MLTALLSTECSKIHCFQNHSKSLKFKRTGTGCPNFGPHSFFDGDLQYVPEQLCTSYIILGWTPVRDIQGP